MIENKFYINLDDAIERRKKFEGTDIVRWPAVSRDEVPEEIDKKMVSMYNFPRQSHLARCGAFCSHMSLLQHIVKNELNNTLILEDDAIQVGELPTEYPDDTITYLGGFFHNNKMMDNTPVKITTKEGLNVLPPKYRILTIVAYIIPSYKLAEEILENIERMRRYKAIDILYGNIGIKRPYFVYPAPFEEEGSKSQIESNKRKRANNKYRWVSN